jgi:hypothetical protein
MWPGSDGGDCWWWSSKYTPTPTSQTAAASKHTPTPTSQAAAASKYTPTPTSQAAAPSKHTPTPTSQAAAPSCHDTTTKSVETAATQVMRDGGIMVQQVVDGLPCHRGHLSCHLSCHLRHLPKERADLGLVTSPTFGILALLNLWCWLWVLLLLFGSREECCFRSTLLMFHLLIAQVDRVPT